MQTEKLGEGDCGVIYKARWRGIDAAVKTLKGSVDYAPHQSSLSESAARADLINEIEMLSCLRHPNVSPPRASLSTHRSRAPRPLPPPAPRLPPLANPHPRALP
jgi:hypothetical protein